MKPLYEITKNKGENLKIIEKALVIYNSYYTRKPTNIVFKYIKSENRFVLGIRSIEAGGLELFEPLTNNTLLCCLNEVARWKYSIRGNNGYYRGIEGIPEYWLNYTLKALPHEMPKIVKVISDEFTPVTVTEIY